MIGRPVLIGGTGAEVGRVKDCIVHRSKKCLAGFLLRHPTWLHPAQAVPFADVTSFDKSAVIVASPSAVGGLDRIPDGPRLLDRKPLIGSLMISSNGHKVGTVKDFYFAEETGEVVGLEVILEDVAEAETDLKFLPLNDEIYVGRDFIVVQEQAANRLASHVTSVIDDEQAVEEPIPVTADNAQSDNLADTCEFHCIEEPQRKPADSKHLTVTPDGSTFVLGFDSSETLDDLCIALCRDEILKALTEHESCKKLSFDVTNVKFLPSGMLGLLASLRKKVDVVEVQNPSLVVREALSILGFNKFITISSNEA